MTMVLDAEATRAVERAARDAERLETERQTRALALEDIIAAHRQALVELAPHQEERAARVETGWHMEHLGVLLCHRDAQMQTQNPAPSGVHLPERGAESNGTDRSRT